MSAELGICSCNPLLLFICPPCQVAERWGGVSFKKKKKPFKVACTIAQVEAHVTIEMQRCTAPRTFFILRFLKIPVELVMAVSGQGQLSRDWPISGVIMAGEF